MSIVSKALVIAILFLSILGFGYYIRGKTCSKVMTTNIRSQPIDRSHEISNDQMWNKSLDQVLDSNLNTSVQKVKQKCELLRQNKVEKTDGSKCLSKKSGPQLPAKKKRFIIF